MVNAAVGIPRLQYTGWLGIPPEAQLTLDISTAAIPVGIAYNVYVISQGVEHPFAGFAVAKGQPSTWTLMGTIPAPPPTAATVIFRPAKRQALATVDTLDVANVELRYDNIPIEGAPPSPSPKKHP